jgi:hypothetical protein
MVDEYDVDDELSYNGSLLGGTSGGGGGGSSSSIVGRSGVAPLVRGKGKVRLSLTEKKKLKKKGLNQTEIRNISLRKSSASKSLADSGVVVSNDFSGKAASTGGSNTSAGQSNTTMSSGLNDTYKDTKHYMAYGDENATESFAEDSMQPQSNLRSSESMSKQHGTDDLLVYSFLYYTYLVKLTFDD